MTTALFSAPACLNHVNPPGHPEQVARLEAIAAELSAPDFAALDRREAPPCDDAALALAHPPAHIRAIEAALPARGFAMIDADTSMSPGSLEAARRAVGGVCAAIDAVLAGNIRNGFAMGRPPGHHAEKTRAMGFCLFSNIAIGALHAIRNHGLGRVAVLDFDVHHGNGTQDVLWDVPEIRFVSSHQMPLYPGSGASDEVGAHGQILNLPLADGSGGAEMRAAWAGALEWIGDWRPELVLVSAGFDAHRRDPLAGLNWATGDFAWLTGEICKMAAKTCDGRVVSALEGGYDLQALADSTAAHVRTLMENADERQAG